MMTPIVAERDIAKRKAKRRATMGDEVPWAHLKT
jgi:hypothetical protein